MPKIAFVGAGSTVFTRNLVGDILSLPELRDTTTFALMDIDAERLRTAEIVDAAAGRGPRRRRAVEAHAGPPRGARRRRLRGHVVPGRRLQAVDRDRLRDAQALRPAPDDRRHARHRRDHARAAHDPGAARRLPRHGGALPGRAAAQLRQPDGDAAAGRSPRRARSARSASATRCSTPRASWPRDLGLPAAEIDYHVAGINHLAFFLRLERDGEDLYPALRERRRPPDDNRVRYELLKHFGYFVTESSEHFAEYVPWFIKAGREDLIERFNIPLDEYPRRCERQIARVGGAARRARGRRRGRAPSAATSTAPTSSAPARPASRSRSTATSRTAATTGC